MPPLGLVEPGQRTRHEEGHALKAPSLQLPDSPEPARHMMRLGGDSGGLSSALTHADSGTATSMTNMLQQHAGNSAVQGLVGQHALGHGGGGGAGAGAISAPSPAGQVSLHNLTGSVGAFRNAQGQRLLQTLDESLPVRADLLERYNWLVHYEKKVAPQDVKSVSKMSSAISQNSKGNKGKDFRENITAYTGGNNKLKAQVYAVTAAKGAVTSAISGVKEATARGNGLNSKRKAKKAEGEVEEVNAKIAKAKESAEWVFDFGLELLTDWKKAIKSVATNLAQTGIKDFITGDLTGALYGAELEAATKKLAEAKREVVQFEDEEQTAGLEKATATLHSALATFEKEKTTLVGATDSVDEAASSVMEQFEDMGPAGETAAAALNQRAEVGESAGLATQLLAQYDGTMKEVVRQAGGLSKDYRNYIETMRLKGDSSGHPDDNARVELRDKALSNAETCQRIEQSGKDSLAELKEPRAYLKAGSYLKAGGAMDDILKRAVKVR